MKKNLLMVAGVLFSTVMFAGGINDPSVSGVTVLNKEGSSTYQLIYKPALATNVSFAIYDANDQLVFSETLRKTEGFSRPYNFAGLSEGNYSINVSDITGKQIEKVNYRAGKVERLVNVLKLNDTDKYLLTIAGKGEERFSLKIYDAAGKLIHDETNMIYNSFGQVYDLSKVTGSVTFEIADKTGTVKTISF
jgi:hypothetical protein